MIRKKRNPGSPPKLVETITLVENRNVACLRFQRYHAIVFNEFGSISECGWRTVIRPNENDDHGGGKLHCTSMLLLLLGKDYYISTW